MGEKKCAGHAPVADFAKQTQEWRYVFVTVLLLVEKCATELYEKLEKPDKTACPCVLREPDRLLFSQWIWGDRQFF